ncbi:salutaridinol 7-o-acetyltransferase [Quercus suber]|uniref:Salutaridinol 7-o-acetyltransferase n=1 Tax=Quercus suber TaxID=58331 RepID=A0AAW0K3F5_QUESU
MDPPLPDTVFGNFVWPFAVIVEEESDLELHKLVQSMRETKNDFLNNKANKFKGKGGFAALMDALKERAEIFRNRKELVVYKCSSWSKFPLYETDFGWGKPVWNTSINKLGVIPFLCRVRLTVTLDEEEIEQSNGILILIGQPVIKNIGGQLGFTCCRCPPDPQAPLHVAEPGT